MGKARTSVAGVRTANAVLTPGRGRCGSRDFRPCPRSVLQFHHSSAACGFLEMCVYSLKRLHQLTFQGTLPNAKQQKACLSRMTAAMS